jgi:hypothetical protein
VGGSPTLVDVIHTPQRTVADRSLPMHEPLEEVRNAADLVQASVKPIADRVVDDGTSWS